VQTPDAPLPPSRSQARLLLTTTTTIFATRQPCRPHPIRSMFVPRSVGRKKAAVATSDTSSARPAESLASTPATTSSSISLPSTPVAAAALSTTGPPSAPPASSTASSSALSKAEVKAAEQQQVRTGRLARELALVLALVLSEGFLAADAGPAGSGLELGKWLTRVNCALCDALV
jgi:hypothetical protein